VTGIGRGVDTLIDDFAADIDAMDIDITRAEETIGGSEVITYTAIDRSGFNFQFPIELMVGANDDVFVLGTRGVVAPVLRGDGGLHETNAFTEAERRYLVDEAGVLMLANPDALMPLANFWAISDPFNPAAGEQAQLIRNVLNAFSSATISGSNRENGSGVSRMTLSLNLRERE
jgi:hypothetical protein